MAGILVGVQVGTVNWGWDGMGKFITGHGWDKTGTKARLTTMLGHEARLEKEGGPLQQRSGSPVAEREKVKTCIWR